MEREYIEEKTFDKIDFTKNPLPGGEYEYCAFKDCDFSNSDLSGSLFMECEFESCNLSMTKLTNATFRDSTFRNCKMLGLHFENCNEFGFSVNFDNCDLNYSSFYRMKMKKTVFKNLRLQEADFTECDLSGSVFDGCDLARAVFKNTIIEKADFRTSFNYSIDPEANRIRKAKFSLSGIAGLLDKYDIEIDIKN